MRSAPTTFPGSCRRIILAMLVLAAGVAAVGAEKTRLSTGKVMKPSDVLQAAPGATLGDSLYAEVNSGSLRHFYGEFRSELFRKGILKQNERFSCKHFAGLFTEMAQARFFRESFRSDSKAQALALGAIWYVRDDGRGPHAIVQALTERGRIYIEPQTGEEISLSPREETSTYFRFF